MVKTGDQIAGYRVESVIGAGGMGVVYEATQLALDRPVALKVLTPGLGADEDFRTRFRREAMLQAALEHPNIVSVYEAGESEDGLYIAMKLVRGVDLTKLIEQGELTPERTLDLLGQIASALDAAHAAGLVHRDVKPQNILVDEDDHAFLADFGLTKGAGDRGLTLTGQYAGSLDYAAPEQIRGEPQGASSDLYAFAAILYEALVGEVVFPYDTEAALLYAHLSENPPQPSEGRPELPAGFDQVIARGLAKRPEERYRTATELIDDARRALASQPLAALPTQDAGSGRRRFSETVVDGAVLRSAPVIAVERERHVPWRAIAATAVALLALAAGGFAIGRVTHTTHAARLGVAQAGPLSLTFPSGDWKPVRVPAIPGLRLESAVALASTDPKRPGTVVAGLAPDAQGAGLLPPVLRAHLTTPAAAETVQVGPAQGLEYASLAAGNVPWRLGLLLVPTPGGAAAVACLSSQVLQAGAEPADCGAVAATLRLHGLRELPLGQSGPEAQAVSSALTLLDGERLTGRRQLAGATLPSEQARAAASLRTAYATAATTIAKVKTSPFARPAQAGLVSALQVASSRYQALAAAARTHDERGYTKAATAVDRAERTVGSAIGALAAVRPAG
jgi:hypothetical protein